MKRIHIIGGKNHGKTTLVTELVQGMTARGIRVGTIKHTHHQHELDVPGKDSHRHRQAGAVVVGILSRSMNAVFWPPESIDDSSLDSRYDVFESNFADCQLVLVEGDTQTQARKIEVWRESLGTAPLALKDPSILAVVSHDKVANLAVPVWPRADISLLADNILALDSAE
ncbi:molybdopterin-guanine dinucleotide biosynthesis protein B [Bythopirellula polymerisocia]|uniref:Molybdopterin-guanine dinucleotide biosynthesis adapter protein n=1 Tax=Bythopirellula polymerisocia TaxID=2528003 RepID=A0A5C6CAY4_9BACT|nr:molybdopterin-guanine dinucleotide biosynthesis protein B [Bythopirellula polymerisocia]TWU21770.1 Molybdopterin-guanine dinucleotide biosynthesis adapter protein [Bythopirellula polymerisocia]